MEYDKFVTCTLPDFTGTRVEAYIDLKDIACHIKHIKRAFPAEDEPDTYFDQCPPGFSVGRLKEFRNTINSQPVQHLCKSARDFQKQTVCR